MKYTVCLLLALVYTACSPAPFDPLKDTYSERDAFKKLYDGRGYSLIDQASMAIIARTVIYNEQHGISSEGSTFGSLLEQGRTLASQGETTRTDSLPRSKNAPPAVSPVGGTTAP
jgi:hypothetical protein